MKDARKMLWLARAVARRRAAYQQFFSRVAHPVSKVATFATAGDIVKASGNGRLWRRDTGAIGDRWIHPGVTQHRLDNGIRTGSYDCDDHALYHIAALFKSGLCRRAWLGFVAWRAHDGDLDAHVIALWEDNDGACWWMDYRAPARFVEMVEWAEAVAQHRGRLVSFSWVEATGLTRSEAVKLDRRSVQLGQLPKTPETASAGS